MMSLIVVGTFFSIRVATQQLPSWGTILGFASNISPEEVINKTNQKRIEEGMPALKLNSELTAAAIAKGQHMLDNQYWSHTSPDGVEPWYFIKNTGYSYQVAGENLARDFSATDEMVSAWLTSPTHRANLLNPKYQEIGIAVIDGKLNGYETTLVVQMFGAQKLVSPQVTDQAVAQERKTIVTQAQAQLEPAIAAATTTKSPITMPLLSPLHLTKAFFLAVTMLISLTLVWDFAVIENRQTARLVGKNIAHLFLLVMVSFLVIFFKGGLIG